MTIKIHTIPADAGKLQKPHRVGRGEGSGWGGTSGKGHKGKKARSGAAKGPSFEGGQSRMIRRLPKFGFTNERFREARAAVTLAQLESRFESGSVVDLAAVHGKRLVSKQILFVKVLATGALAKPLTVKLQGFSAKAKQAIEAVGGTCETVRS